MPEQERNTVPTPESLENYRKAVIALKLDRPQMAIELLRKVLREQPEHVRAHRLMALASLESRDLTQAEQAVREALRLEPQSSSLHVLYGLILFQKRQIKLAKAELNEALRLNPIDPWPYFFLGALYLFLPVPLADEARPYTFKAIELAPDEAPIQMLFAKQANADGHLTLARAAYYRALTLEPQNPFILREYGDFLLNRQVQPQQALQVLKEAIRLDPNDKQTQKLLLKAIRAAHPLYRPITAYQAYRQQAPQALKFGMGCAASLFILIIGRLFLHFVEAIFNLGVKSHNAQLLNISMILMCLGIIITPYGLIIIYRAIMAPLLLFLIKRGWVK
ncbi:tetratricopeptide repeat protein [Thermogemmatispora sp.]|uniref:tetratricopeptide repeat protein n=1 Tax=Thermogemmatispora sp. TaxID=1968838 RepID=UPI001D36491B|nr:tetratricopeptide repeat protein [Thermogemmatispora sp.]MBX5451768.1 tetratricopeptide repeat protein [Thermogemmatispora sp.]